MRRLRALAVHLGRQDCLARGPAAAQCEAADFVVRGALVVDGTGEPTSAIGDVAVKDGKVLSVGGAFTGATVQEVDGRGKVLSPGIIDIHTHYDPQLCWDGAARPCLEHGVTTIVTGNCSLSVAPCRNEHDAERMVDMFFTIEDIKPKTFAEGVPFEQWESFGDWLRWLQPSLSVNLAALVGHSAVRLFVMGEASQEREATDDELAQMCSVVEEAMRDGALGVSTSYVDIDSQLRPVPSRFADTRERTALASAMSKVGRGLTGEGPGMWACVHAFNDAGGGKDRDMGEYESIRELGEISKASRAPVSFQPVNLRRKDECRQLMEEIQRDGGKLYGQVAPGDISNHLRLSETNNSMMSVRGWGKAMKITPRSARIANFSDPDAAAILIENLERAPNQGAIGQMVVTFVAHPHNQKYLGMTVKDAAELEGVELGRLIIDVSLRDNLEAEFSTFVKRSRENREMIAAMASGRESLFQLGAFDSGALSFTTTAPCATAAAPAAAPRWKHQLSASPLNLPPFVADGSRSSCDPEVWDGREHVCPH